MTAVNANNWFGSAARESNRRNGLSPKVSEEDKQTLSKMGAILEEHVRNKRKQD